MTSTTAKKIIIRVIVALFLMISGLAFVPYLLPSSSAPIVPEDTTVDLETYLDTETTDIVVPSNETPNVNTPGENDIQVVVTEKEDQNEMDQTIEVLLENGEMDTPTVGDFSDSLQLSSSSSAF
ncbi:MAG: hypothetical protein LBG59_07710 [Candidatus Peribacteria bacterium]|jgi:hypothetical protein|nr:hypothetical protein [Candidatus Peribacteria bacterium]